MCFGTGGVIGFGGATILGAGAGGAGFGFCPPCKPPTTSGTSTMRASIGLNSIGAGGAPPSSIPNPVKIPIQMKSAAGMIDARPPGLDHRLHHGALGRCPIGIHHYARISAAERLLQLKREAVEGDW